MTSVADIIGPEAAAGEPASIHRQASHLRDLAETASHIQGQIGALTPSRWTGQSAAAFHASRDEDLPTQLGRLSAMLATGASALSGWAGDLDDIQHRARELARRKDQAVQAAQAAQTRAAAARHKVQQAQRQQLSSIGDPVASAKSAVALVATKRASVAADVASGGASRAVVLVDAQALALRAELGLTSHRRGRELGDAGDPISIGGALAALGAVGAIVGRGSRPIDTSKLGTGGVNSAKLVMGFLNDGRVQTAFNYVNEAFGAGQEFVDAKKKTLVEASRRFGTQAKDRLISVQKNVDGKAGNLFRGGARILGPAGVLYGVYQTGSDVMRRGGSGDYGGAIISGVGGGISVVPAFGLFDFATGGFLGPNKGVISGTTSMLADSVTDPDAATQRALEGGYGPGMQVVAHAGDAMAEVGDPLGAALYEAGSAATNGATRATNAASDLVGQGAKSFENVFRF